MNDARKSGLTVTIPVPSAYSIVPRSHGARKLVLALAISLCSALVIVPGQAGEKLVRYKVLLPITHGNLSIFPVLADSSYDTRNFLTLDEGLRSGEVMVTEAGRIPPLLRRHPIWGDDGGAEVNRLVLVNNSDRPLILLAGEILTGGKQDRVIGKDRIVPPKSEPIDLSVFCVEPQRWVETAGVFGSLKSQMAQPSVRREAMADKDQQRVWAEVGRSAAYLASAVPGAGRALRSTSSYAQIMENGVVQSRVDAVAAPIEHAYDNLMRELRARNAVGVVVAVNGDIIWADLFASTSLLDKYWPKLIRSYAAEAITRHITGGQADVKSALAFLQDFQGRRESVESEPGVYRHTEISGSGFTAFELTSLLPGTNFDVHIAKMVR